MAFGEVIFSSYVRRYYNGEITPAPDVFITNQKLSSVEEAVLIKHSISIKNKIFY